MDARITSRENVYHGWVSVERIQMQMPDGAVVERHIEDHGSAVAVLVYNQQRRSALLVRMPRAPVLDFGGEALLEVVAGAKETNENPLTCAGREVFEEVGVRDPILRFVAHVWTIPSVSRERIHLYFGEYTDAMRINSGGGATDEHENIVVQEIKLNVLWQLAISGEIKDLKTLVLVYALKNSEPNLFT